MDIESIVDDLKAERDRLDGIIVALERLQGAVEQTAAPKRRGRKFMDKQGRKEVSERMKRYWADRRTSRIGKTEHADAASVSGDSSDRVISNELAHVIAA